MGPQVVGPLELVQRWSQKLPSAGMNRALILPEGIKLFYRVLPLLWLLEAWLGLPWAGLDGLWAVHDGLHHLMYMWVESDPNQTQTQNKPKWKEKWKMDEMEEELHQARKG